MTLPLEKRWIKYLETDLNMLLKFMLIVPMTDVIASIEERRIAFLELSFIMNHVKKQYGDDPPMEVRNTLAELAAIYRKKYGNHPVKTKDNNEDKNFFL